MGTHVGSAATLLALMGLLGAPEPADAVLLERFGGLAYYDTELDVTWRANTYGPFIASPTMTWNDANTWVNNLTDLGFDDWRLPTAPEVDTTCQLAGPPANSYGCTASELGHLYHIEFGLPVGPFQGIALVPFPFIGPVGGTVYWMGTPADSFDPDPDNPFTGSHLVFIWDQGDQNGLQNFQLAFAWALRDGDVAPQPVPSVTPRSLVFLFGALLAAARLAGPSIRGHRHRSG